MGGMKDDAARAKVAALEAADGERRPQATARASERDSNGAAIDAAFGLFKGRRVSPRMG